MSVIDGEWQAAVAGSICRNVRCVWLGTPVGVAVEAMRLGGLTELPVMAGAQVYGVVTLARLTDAICEAGDAVRSIPLGQVLERDVGWRNLKTGLYVASVNSPLTEVESYFRENPTHQIAPVIDPPSGLLGVITRADLAAARLRSLAPARIGGMATPLGVYLTDGLHSGGAGDLGLFLSGVLLASLGIVASIGLAIASSALHLDARLAQMGNMPWSDLESVLLLPLVMILIRLVPLSGYHAAEHQVVHCIERGEILSVSMVKTMPRVHPRCGTNIASGLSIFSVALCVGVIAMKSIIGAVVPAALITVALWRPVGSFLQQYFTTKAATQRQLESGIFAAEDLLRKYRADARAVATPRTRMWRMGLMQTAVGAIAASVVLSALIEMVPAFRAYVPSLF